MGMTGFDREISRAMHRNHGIVLSPVTSGDTALTGKNIFARVQRSIRSVTASMKETFVPSFAAIPVAV